MANQASWIVRKILQAGHWLEEKGLQIAEIMETDEYQEDSTPKIDWQDGGSQMIHYVHSAWKLMNPPAPILYVYLLKSVVEKTHELAIN
ncbi:hypothetical protein H5410_025455 [Solanum commersonii]|uniref:Uncharacterized protein n=1 Tax=Solanum commersonii TaxID=4109 RepID=A0A9J5YT59_SOLCO|nr:hypothetical protein H5410_025455 [Solanum commersonii]